ncbi:MAG: hypothetical protein R3257_02710, partial [bacterium]|nr:hypothetical protein [bacterium]
MLPRLHGESRGLDRQDSQPGIADKNSIPIQDATDPSLGTRLENHTQFFLEHATDPAMLFAVGSAGLANSIGRLLGTRYFLRPRNWIKNALGGWGVRGSAALTAFALEVPAFTLGEMGASQALGRQVEWSPSHIAGSMGGAVFLLGGIKLGNWGSQQLVQGLKLQGPGITQKVLTGGVRETGAVLGIMGGHRAQAWAMGGSQPDFAANLMDSIA